VLELPRLDRIVRGRAWIPLLGVMLVAIVGLRVEVLKLGSSVGRQLQQATTLESSNAMLRSRVSELSGNERISKLAEGMGMLMPGPMDIHFVKAAAASHTDATVDGIHSPSGSEFLSGVASERQADSDNSTTAADTSTIGVLTTGVTGGTTSTDTPTSTGGGSTTSTYTPVDSTSSTGTASTDTSSVDTASADTSSADTGSVDTSSADTSTATADSSAGGSYTTPPTDSSGTTPPAGSSDTTPPAGPATGGASLAG
jgi:hypothetical protein